MDLDWLYPGPKDYRPLRGTDRLDRKVVLEHALRYDPDPAWLLGVPIPRSLFYRGTVIQGGQGSGKTLAIESRLLQVLPELGRPGSRRRVIVIDPKGDLTPFVLGLRRVVCPRAPVYLVNPFDRLGTGLSPGDFARSPTKITQLIHSLTHRRDGRSDEFFDNSARGYLVDLVKVLERRVPGRWDWRAFYLIATSPRLLKKVLRNSRLGRRKTEAIVTKTFNGIVNTIEAWLQPYESAIACWDRSPGFSLREFLRGSGVLVMTTPADETESLTPIARMLLRVVNDLLLTDTGRDPESHTTIVLDEFADLEQCVKVLAPLFGRSRAAQVSLICAWQSWPAACDSHGEARMKAVLDNAAIRVWLIAGAESAELAAKQCGTIEVRQEDRSFTEAEKASNTRSYRTTARQTVLASEFQGLAPPAPGDLTVRGYLTASHLPGPVYCEQDLGPLAGLVNALDKPAAVRERHPEDFWLPPWDDAKDGTWLEELFTREK